MSRERKRPGPIKVFDDTMTVPMEGETKDLIYKQAMAAKISAAQWAREAFDEKLQAQS